VPSAAILPLLLCLAQAAAPVGAAPRAPGVAGRRASAPAIGHYLDAQRAQVEGDFPRALEELRLALVFDETSPQIRVAHAVVLARLDRLDEAEREAGRAVALAPEGEEAADAWLLLGRIAAHRSDRRRAADALRTAAALELKLAAARGPDEDHSPDPEPWRVLARAQQEGGDEEGAAATWADLGRTLPAEAARGYREMARAYLERRDAARAEKYLAAATAMLPGDLDAWKGLAQLAERRRAWAQARTAWEAALRADPDDLAALAALGRLSARLGDVPAAQAYFRQLRLLDPDDAAALVATAMGWIEARRADEALAQLDAWKGPPEPRLAFARGLALEELKRWAEAAAAFAEIGTEDQELWATSRVNRTYALAQAGRNQEALRAIEEVTAARPEAARPVATRAWVLERLGRVAEAERMLKSALAGRWPQGAEGRTDLVEALARALARAGRPAEAVALLTAEVAARPRDEELLFALGVAQERLGDLGAALAQMKALLALSPDHAEAMNFVGYSYAERGERLEEAERLVIRALELRPGNGFFLDSLGWIHYQRGDLGRAVTTLEQADAAAGPEPTILEHLGDAYRRVQRGADAAQAYRRALRSIDGGEAQDGPEKLAQQRAALERKLLELAAREARPARN